MKQVKPAAHRLLEIILALAIASSFGTFANAEASADRFLQIYDQANPKDKLIFGKVLGSAQNGMAWSNEALQQEHGFRLFCAPEHMAFVDQQVVAIMREFVKNHPERQGAPYGMVLLLALKEAFPCK
jgi:hypothetical protein